MKDLALSFYADYLVALRYLMCVEENIIIKYPPYDEMKEAIADAEVLAAVCANIEYHYAGMTRWSGLGHWLAALKHGKEVSVKIAGHLFTKEEIVEIVGNAEDDGSGELISKVFWYLKDLDEESDDFNKVLPSTLDTEDKVKAMQTLFTNLASVSSKPNSTAMTRVYMSLGAAIDRGLGNVITEDDCVDDCYDYYEEGEE